MMQNQDRARPALAVKLGRCMMRPTCIFLILLPALMSPGPAPLPGPARAGQQVPAGFRSPIDVAIVPGGKYALTANHTSHSVSLIELASGKVVAEESCGQKPSALACSRDR